MSINILNDNQKHKPKKYAIFLLCYQSDYYLMGLICSLYAHKKLLEKRQENEDGMAKDIDIVVMCDSYIYNFKEYIEVYCDRLINLELDKLEGHSGNYKNEKYRQPWMNYIINKWKALYFQEYQKILFIDIDILVLSSSYYQIFETFNEQFVFNIREKANDGTNRIFDKNKMITSKYNSYKEYIENNKYYIDAGLILLTPNKQLYEEYFTFLKTNQEVHKYVAQKSGVDETSLFYFLVHVKNIEFQVLPEKYSCVIPWETKKEFDENKLKNEIIKTDVINYLSEVKPFVKPVIFMWKEEFIWKILEKQIISGSKFLQLLSLRNALYTFLLEDSKKLRLGGYIKSKSFLIKQTTDFIKHSLSLDNPLFKKDNYENIIKSEILLLSFKNKLNQIFESININKECCGYITLDKFKELI